MRIHECTFSLDRNECVQLCDFWLTRIWPRVDLVLRFHTLFHLAGWTLLGVLFLSSILNGSQTAVLFVSAFILFVAVGIVRVWRHSKNFEPVYCATLPRKDENPGFVMGIRLDETGMELKTDRIKMHLGWNEIRDIRSDRHGLFVFAPKGLITIPRQQSDSQAWILLHNELKRYCNRF